MNKNFTVEICSDLNYEEMVADISYEDNIVAIITQEKGITDMEIEIFPPEEISSWKFFLDDLVKAIQLAKLRLIEMQKLPE